MCHARDGREREGEGRSVWGRCIGRMSEAPEALPSSNHCEGGTNSTLALRRPSLLAFTTAIGLRVQSGRTTHQLTSKIQLPVPNGVRELRGLVNQIYSNPRHDVPISSQPAERCTRYRTSWPCLLLMTRVSSS